METRWIPAVGKLAFKQASSLNLEVYLKLSAFKGNFILKL